MLVQEMCSLAAKQQYDKWNKVLLLSLGFAACESSGPVGWTTNVLIRPMLHRFFQLNCNHV